MTYHEFQQIHSTSLNSISFILLIPHHFLFLLSFLLGFLFHWFVIYQQRLHWIQIYLHLSGLHFQRSTMGGDDKTEKTTIMVLNVDLQCPSCYKKVKKVLCKILQVRNQVYDEKTNTVTITVMCCSPEKIRDKLCYKGGKAIKSIEIKEPEKPKLPPPPPPGPPEKQKSKVVENLGPKPIPFKTYDEKSKDKTKDSKKHKEGTKAAMVVTPWAPDSMVMIPIQGFPQPPVGCGHGQCYHTGGPCYQYYGTPIPPTPYYGNYWYGYGPGPGPSGYGNGCYVYCDYFSEENASRCIIM